MLPSLLKSAGMADDEDSQLNLLNFVMETMQSTGSTDQGELMSLLLPAISKQFENKTPEQNLGGRRLEAEHVDFEQLSSIFAGE
jgi:hypothetical protein